MPLLPQEIGERTCAELEENEDKLPSSILPLVEAGGGAMQRLRSKGSQYVFEVVTVSARALIVEMSLTLPTFWRSMGPIPSPLRPVRAHQCRGFGG
jgi:hypothetical protein